MNVFRFTAVCLSLALLPGCSFVMVQGPQPVGHPDREASSQTCTSSKQWVAVDGLLGGVLGLAAVAALANAEGFEDWVPLEAGPTAVVGGVLAGVAGWSAYRGNGKVTECRDLQLQLGGAQQAALNARRSTSGPSRAAMDELRVPEIADPAVPVMSRPAERRAGSN